MHAHLILLAQSAPTTVAKSTKTGSSSFFPLLIIVGVFAVVYFVFIRPRQQRLRQQQTAVKQLAIGDEVMSAGGIFGRVVALDSDAVEVEVAPGVVMTFIRRAVSPRPADASRGSVKAPEPDDAPWNAGPTQQGQGGSDDPGGPEPAGD